MVFPKDIIHYVSDNKTEIFMDWYVVPSTQPIKVGTKLTNLMWEEVLALEDVWFQLQQMEAFSPRCKLSTMQQSQSFNAFMCATKSITHSYSRFSKKVHSILATPTKDLKNKWESAKLMEKYHAMGVIVIPYPGCGMIINILSKDNNSYCVTNGTYHTEA